MPAALPATVRGHLWASHLQRRCAVSGRPYCSEPTQGDVVQPTRDMCLRWSLPGFRPRLIGALLTGAVGLASCSSGPSSTAPSATSTSTSSSTGLDLEVTPNVSLHNGEVVEVIVSGFPPGKVFLSECASAEDVSGEGCGPQLAAQPFLVIEYGAGTASFSVADQAASAPLSPPSAACTNHCVLVATSGVPASGARRIQTAPLMFTS